MCFFFKEFLLISIYPLSRNILYSATSFISLSTFREAIFLPSLTNYLLQMSGGVPHAKGEKEFEGCCISSSFPEKQYQ